MSEFKAGDPVRVKDAGLEMLQRFAPVGAFPNNWGWIMDEPAPAGDVMVEFPIGDDPLDEHSQAVPYSLDSVFPRDGQTRQEYAKWQKEGGKQRVG